MLIRLNELKEKASEKFNQIKESAKEKFNAMKETMGNIMGAAKETISEKLNKIKGGNLVHMMLKRNSIRFEFNWHDNIKR